MADSVSATPQNPVLGALARVLKFREQAQQGLNSPTGTLLDLILPTAQTVEKWSYGDPLFRMPPPGTGGYVPVPTRDKEYLAESISYAPIGLPAKAAATGVMMTPPIGAIKPKGGNWLAGQVERAIEPVYVRDTQMPYIGQDPAFRLRDMEASLAQNVEAGIPVDMAYVQSERDRLASGVAINKWLDSKLTKYIKNEMATPEDPLRLQADRWAKEQQPKLLAEKQAQLDKAVADMEKAQRERGVEPEMLTRSRARILELQKERDFIASRSGLHIDMSRREFGEPQYRVLQKYRQELGYPAEATAESMQGRKWEDLADYYMQKAPAGDIIQENYFVRPTDAQRIYAENPWLFKVPPETGVYSLNRGISQNETGFKHMTDELKNAMNPDSGLPKELQITPKDLEKMNVAQVADLVDRINAHRAVQKAEADALAAQKSIVVHKEYPDSPEGMRWVEMKLIEPTELKLPEGYKMIDDPVRDTAGNPVQQGYRLYSPEGVPLSYGETPTQAYAKHFGKKDLEAALKYEGDVMGHCVGGYCPDVAEGKSRIFSLRDAKGKPQVTIEVKRAEQNFQTFWDSLTDAQRAELQPVISQRTADMISQVEQRPEIAQYGMQAVENMAWKMGVESLPQFKQYMSQPRLYIEQIKGPGNKKPDEQYLPFVQDFVKSQPWSSVGDLQNTGLMKYRNEYVSPAELEYLTEDKQWVNLLDFAKKRFPDSPTQQGNFIRGAESMPEDLLRPAAGGAVGMAAGGLVEYDPLAIEERAVALLRELNLPVEGTEVLAERDRERQPLRPEDLQLREGALSARPVKAATGAGYDLRLGVDAAPGVQPFADVDPFKQLVTRYGVQATRPLPGGVAAAEYVIDPAARAQSLSGVYRQRLGRDSELTARGGYTTQQTARPSYGVQLQYRRRFAAGGSVAPYDEGKIQGLADHLREELHG